MLGLFKQQNVSHKIIMLPLRSVLAHCLKCMENDLCSHPSPMPSESMELCNYIYLRMCHLSGIRPWRLALRNAVDLLEMVLLLHTDA